MIAARLVLLLLLMFPIFLMGLAMPVSVQANNFEEVLKYANSLRRTVQSTTSKFKPEEVFKNQKGGYTTNPSQANYYSKSISGNLQALEKDAVREINKDEDYRDSQGNSVPTPGKAVTRAFSTRNVFKINPESEYVKRGQLIKDNASNVVGGVSNKHIDCDSGKASACKTIYIDKTCNEEIRTVKRICEKTPRIDVTIEDLIYPNCKSIVVTQGEYNYCPDGYSQVLYSDMVEHVNYDDVRICLKDVSKTESSECFGGYLVYGIANGSYRNVKSTSKATVPKNLQGRLKFSNVFSKNMIVTIINETTGKTIYDKRHFTNGEIIELPFSETQDQIFTFGEWGSEERRLHFLGGHNGGIGVMVLSFDHRTKIRVSNITWKEVCRDI